MGFIKKALGVGFWTVGVGLPVKGTTTRERSRNLQREGNKLLGEIAESVADRPLAPRVDATVQRRTPQVVSTPSVDFVEQLDRLSELREAGALSDAEYIAAKQKVLRQAGIAVPADNPTQTENSAPSLSGVSTGPQEFIQDKQDADLEESSNDPRIARKLQKRKRLGESLIALADNLDPAGDDHETSDCAGEVDFGTATLVDFVLENRGSNAIGVIKLLREYSGLDLKEAKDLINNCPSLLATDIPVGAANEMKAAFEALGASVSLRPSS